MARIRLTVFLIVVFINALLCLLYYQPRRPAFSVLLGVRPEENGDHSNDTNCNGTSPNTTTPNAIKAESSVLKKFLPSKYKLSKLIPVFNRDKKSKILSGSSVKLPNKVIRENPVPLSHPYRYLINPKDLCLKSGARKLALLIVVCSSVRNFRERQGIRDTWGSASSKTGNTGSVRLLFLLGSTNDTDITRQVNEESAKYRDVAQEDFVDSYQNLTLKSVMMLKWTSEFCPNAQFVLKTDDDMYINVPSLLRAASRIANKRNLIFGVLFRKANPERNASAKWYVPESQYLGRVFPDYLSGTAYAMTADVVTKLFNVSLTKPFLIMEDVFVTGICASTAGVKRFMVKGFSHFKRPSTGCAFKDQISGHHVSVPEMHKIWRELRVGTLQCRSSKRMPKRIG